MSWHEAVKVFALVLAVVWLGGCAEKGGGPPGKLPAVENTAGRPLSETTRKITNDFLGTIAVAKIIIEHPSAKLVYRPNGVSDNIVRLLQATGNYRVIDWTNLQDVLFRRNLEWSDLQSSQDVGRQIQDVLFNDYFLMGTVTSYGERMEFSSSAFSKTKQQVVSTTVELAVKNALTNEIIASVQGGGEETKEITQTLGFGAAGGIDTVIATSVIDKALRDGVVKLTEKLASLPRPGGQGINTAVGSSKSGKLSLGHEFKILCVFFETEEGKSRNGGDLGTINLSVAEHAMAKEFHQGGGRVLTADDVINHAFSIAGGENLLSGGWASEQDFMEVENLLQARSGLASYALSVGRTAKADIVVSGTGSYQVEPVAAGPGGLKGQQSSVFLAAKAIDVASGEVLHLASTRQNFTAIAAPSALNAKTNALELASRKAAQEIILRLREYKK